MSPSSTGKAEGEFTKWLRKWMLRSEKSRTIRGRTSRTDPKNDMRMIEKNNGQIRTDVVRRADMETSRRQDQGEGAVEHDQKRQVGDTSTKG